MKASVIIPAFNAQKTIRNCLESVFLQSTPKKDFEVIVVDDGSSDQTPLIVSEYKNVLLLSQKNSGPAKARNWGAAKAKGEIVVFLDSDCVAKKDWLFEMLRPFEDSAVAGVQGRYENGVSHWMAELVQLEIEERYERLKAAMKKNGSIDFVSTYSAAYRKKVFLENKGFDEGYRQASGEDTEFSFRLSEKGHKLVFAPKAVVRHFHPSTLQKYLKTKFFRAYWRVRLYAKHPKKMLNDSYTNPWIKFQMILAGVFLLSLIVTLLNSYFQNSFAGQFGEDFALATLILLLLFSVSNAFFILRKNAILGLAAIVIFSINSFVFLAGYSYGILQSKGAV